MIDSKNRIQQIALVHSDLGPRAIIWRKGYQRTYFNLSESTVWRTSRLLDKLMLQGCFWITSVGTGAIGWMAGRVS